MSRATDEIRRLVGPLDPMRADTRAVTPPQLDLAAAGPEPPRRHPVRRRSLLAAAAAVVVVAGAVVVWNAAGPSAPKGYAATPPPLTIVPSSDTRPGKAVLEEIAAKAASSGVPAGSPGGTEYRKIQGWSLNSQVGGGETVSAIEATESESWRHRDGSGRSVIRRAPPEFQSDADREKWVSDQSGGVNVRDFGPGTFPTDMMKVRPPVGVEALHEWLRASHPHQDDPFATIDAVTDLILGHVLLPAERSTLLQVIATLPGLRLDGGTRDRAGRPGLAFAMDPGRQDGLGLPARYTFIIDPADGRILGFEQMLTRDPGALRVRIPAVISYYAYLVDEFQGVP